MECVLKNGNIISCEIVRKDVKNINLRIHSDLRVTVSVNDTITNEEIKSFIFSKSDFIFSNIEKFSNINIHHLKYRFVSGETIYIFGKECSLIVKKANKNYIEFDGTNILLFVKDKADYEMKKKTLSKWIKSLCKEKFDGISQETYKIFKKYNVEMPCIKIRTMKSKWGSCQYQKKFITLNSKLIFYPMECVEYVIMHEFCHFIEPNHSKKFYTFLTIQMPDWKRRKEILEKDVYLI